ncbi:M20/M25/M40 family metallo-hydrolase, partial [Mesorhizobium helmanticense]
MDVFDILDRLVAFPSVAGKPNGDIAGWIETHLTEHRAQVNVILGPEGDRSNLFATVGPADVPGYILSGHMDVVPAGEAQWSSAPFTLRRDCERLYGRGTTDM